MSDDNISHRPLKEIRNGSFILIDGVPCKVVDIEISAPGKHGSAKMRITAMSVFENGKKTLLAPSHGDIDVPEIKKRRAQVVSITGTNVQLMDMDTYDIFDAAIPEDLKNTLKPGNEVETLEAMGKRIITRIVGGT
ncbi:Translation initiation factor 5A [uncultured archaeon]|nr:Translation initiation factor 5A [uncultured archaeon]